jgi:hypothetical protein
MIRRTGDAEPLVYKAYGDSFEDTDQRRTQLDTHVPIIS